MGTPEEDGSSPFEAAPPPHVILEKKRFSEHPVFTPKYSVSGKKANIA